MKLGSPSCTVTNLTGTGVGIYYNIFGNACGSQ